MPLSSFLTFQGDIKCINRSSIYIEYQAGKFIYYVSTQIFAIQPLSELLLFLDSEYISKEDYQIT